VWSTRCGQPYPRREERSDSRREVTRSWCCVCRVSTAFHALRKSAPHFLTLLRSALSASGTKPSPVRTRTQGDERLEANGTKAERRLGAPQHPPTLIHAHTLRHSTTPRAPKQQSSNVGCLNVVISHVIRPSRPTQVVCACLTATSPTLIIRSVHHDWRCQHDQPATRVGRHRCWRFRGVFCSPSGHVQGTNARRSYAAPHTLVAPFVPFPASSLPRW
jgi:hypothetical protein